MEVVREGGNVTEIWNIGLFGTGSHPRGVMTSWNTAGGGKDGVGLQIDGMRGQSKDERPDGGGVSGGGCVFYKT